MASPPRKPRWPVQMLRPSSHPPATRLRQERRVRTARDAAAHMARAWSARSNAQADAAAVTDAVDAAAEAGVAGVAGSVAKERRASPWGKSRCARSRALLMERMLLRPNRAKARTGRAVAMREEIVAKAVLKAALKAAGMAEAKVAVKLAVNLMARVAVKGAVGAHAAPGAMNPLALRPQAAPCRPWTHRVFFHWISQAPAKLMTKSERSASRPNARQKRVNHVSRASVMTVVRVVADAMGGTGIADASAWIKPRASTNSQSAMARRRRSWPRPRATWTLTQRTQRRPQRQRRCKRHHKPLLAEK